MRALDWPGNAAFNAAPVQNWTVNGAAAGTIQSYETLNFLRVFKAGHMVRIDAGGGVCERVSHV